MTNREPARDGQTKVRTYGRLEWGVNGGAPEPEHRLLPQTIVEDHAADDLAQPRAAVFLSRQQTTGTTPTACIRFAVLSRIEILHNPIRTLLRFSAQ
jgi:hypothetical protein